MRLTAINILARDIADWSRDNFGNQESKIASVECPKTIGLTSSIRLPVPLHSLAPLLGIGEEIGEFIAASTRNDMRDAAGDILIYLLDFASREEAVVRYERLSDLHNIYLPQVYTLLSLYNGRLCHHVLKRHQGIRGYTDQSIYEVHRDRELSNIWRIIDDFASAYFDISALDLAREVFDKIVKKRNWVKKPVTADDQIPNLPENGDKPLVLDVPSEPGSGWTISECLACGKSHSGVPICPVTSCHFIEIRHQFTEIQDDWDYFVCPHSVLGEPTFVFINPQHEQIVATDDEPSSSILCSRQ